jgi:1,4-alpha-glucan branching enzyme
VADRASTVATSVPAASSTCFFLDVLSKIDYFAQLGVNAIQPLPIVEFPPEYSLG